MRLVIHCGPWTRQIPVVMLSLGAMMITIFMTQGSFTTSLMPLIFGWLAFGLALPIAERLKKQSNKKQALYQTS